MSLSDKTPGTVDKEGKKRFKKVLTNGMRFGNISERSEIQSEQRTLKIKQREEEKPLKINLRSTSKYNSNSRGNEKSQ